MHYAVELTSNYTKGGNEHFIASSLRAENKANTCNHSTYHSYFPAAISLCQSAHQWSYNKKLKIDNQSSLFYLKKKTLLWQPLLQYGLRQLEPQLSGTTIKYFNFVNYPNNPISDHIQLAIHLWLIKIQTAHFLYTFDTCITEIFKFLTFDLVL